MTKLRFLLFALVPMCMMLCSCGGSRSEKPAATEEATTPAAVEPKEAAEPKTLEELLSTDSAWKGLQERFKSATNDVVVIPIKDETKRNAALLATQVPTSSDLGAVVYETGGVLVDHGWLRILGSGGTKIKRSVSGWTKTATGKPIDSNTPFILIADDAVGGFYVLDGGGLGDAGKVFYLSPDNMKWENMNTEYGGFIDFCCNGDLKKYYESYRWPGWEKKVEKISCDQTLAIYPPLWTVDAKSKNKPIGERSMRPVPVLESYISAVGSAKKFLGISIGSDVKVKAVK